MISMLTSPSLGQWTRSGMSCRLRSLTSLLSGERLALLDELGEERTHRLLLGGDIRVAARPGDAGCGRVASADTRAIVVVVMMDTDDGTWLIRTSPRRRTMR